MPSSALRTDVLSVALSQSLLRLPHRRHPLAEGCAITVLVDHLLLVHAVAVLVVEGHTPSMSWSHLISSIERPCTWPGRPGLRPRRHHHSAPPACGDSVVVCLESREHHLSRAVPAPLLFAELGSVVPVALVARTGMRYDMTTIVLYAYWMPENRTFCESLQHNSNLQNLHDFDVLDTTIRFCSKLSSSARVEGARRT